MNKWRHVTYDDDGVNIYQCLQCKSSIALRSPLGRFCNYCGTQWESEHIWEDKWKQEHYWRDILYTRFRQEDDAPDASFWMIERRFTEPFWGQEWFYQESWNVRNGDIQNVLARLKEIKRIHDDSQVRITIVPRSVALARKEDEWNKVL